MYVVHSIHKGAKVKVTQASVLDHSLSQCPCVLVWVRVCLPLFFILSPLYAGVLSTGSIRSLAVSSSLSHSLTHSSHLNELVTLMLNDSSLTNIFLVVSLFPDMLFDNGTFVLTDHF